MNFVIALVVSVLEFMAFRLGVISLYVILCRLFKRSHGNDRRVGFDLAFSIAFLVVYLQCFVRAVDGVTQNVDTSLEVYLMYTSMGIIAMLWCYFSWDFRLAAWPKWGDDEKIIAIKKIIVYGLVMCFAFYYGYLGVDNLVYQRGIDAVVTLTNLTMVSGLIAFDRVLNQFMNLRKNRKK